MGWLELTKNLKPSGGEGVKSGAPDGIVLDLLHARKVSPLNLQFKSAQFPRYPA